MPQINEKSNSSDSDKDCTEAMDILDEQKSVISEASIAAAAAATAATATAPNASDSISKPMQPSDSRMEERIVERVASWTGEHMLIIRQEISSHISDIMKDVRREIKQHIDELGPWNEDRMAELEEENSKLKDKVQILEGRLSRTETEVAELREEVLQQQARSMRDNLKFFNIQEVEKENCEETLRQFLRTEMKISEEKMKQIKFDRVHRIGPKTQTRHRFIVAKFNPYIGKTIVLEHIQNLDKNKGFGVNEQLPRELEERKKRLIPAFKQAKHEKKNPKWSNEKLIIGGKVTESRKDTVKDINIDLVQEAVELQSTIKSGPLESQGGSSFRGHCIDVSKQDDVIPALHALYADNRIARATHNVYAYRLKTESGNIVEHYDDDREWGAGRILLEQLRKGNHTNKLVCVSRWYGGVKMGKQRFELIKKQAQGVLKMH